MSNSSLVADKAGTAGRIAWVVLLTLGSLAFSYVFACAAPVAALATLAALNLRRQDAYILTVLVWLANQAVGYGVLNYPHSFDSYAWGVAIGVAALLATHTVITLGPRPLRTGPVSGPAIGFLAAFVVHEIALYAAGLVLGATDAAFSAPIIWYVLKVNAIALAGLVVLSLGARVTGLARPLPMPANRY